MTHSDISKCQQTEQRKEARESVFLQTCPQGGVNVWMKPPLPSLISLKRQRWKKKKKPTTNLSAGGHLQSRAKERTAMLPVVLGTAAALAHYPALPQRSDGGWDGAQPHSGHRGRNESQMCWGDMKNTRTGILLSTFKYEHARLYIHALTQRQRRLWYLKNVSRNGKSSFFVIVVTINRWNKSSRLWFSFLFFFFFYFYLIITFLPSFS